MRSSAGISDEAPPRRREEARRDALFLRWAELGLHPNGEGDMMDAVTHGTEGHS
jgi:hypothetical protein